MTRRGAVGRQVLEAVRAAERGDLDDGLGALRRVCDEHPRDVDARLAYADVQIRGERYADAVATATIAIGLDREDARGHYARARAQAGRGKLSEALADARRAAALAPTWAEAQLMRGWLELDHHNLVEAAEAAEAVISLDRAKVAGHALLAEVALEAEEWDILAMSSRAVLRLHRDDKRGRELLAYSEARQKETGEPTWRPDTAMLVPEHGVDVEAGTLHVPTPPTSVELPADAALPADERQDTPVPAPEMGTPPPEPVRSIDLTDGEHVISLPEGTPKSRRPAPPVALVVVGIAVLVVGVLLLMGGRASVGAVLLVAGAGIVAAAFLRRAPAPDLTRERVRAQLGVPERSAEFPEATSAATGGTIGVSRQPPPPPPEAAAREVANERKPHRPQVVREVVDDEASSTIYVPTGSVDHEEPRGDEVATLRAAADAAIEKEDWTTAEAHLRRLLELEPLYIPAHGRLTYVLKQQRPSWSSRRQF